MTHSQRRTLLILVAVNACLVLIALAVFLPATLTAAVPASDLTATFRPTDPLPVRLAAPTASASAPAPTAAPTSQAVVWVTGMPTLPAAQPPAVLLTAEPSGTADGSVFLPVIIKDATLTPTATPTASLTPTASPTPPAGYISQITEHAGRIFLQGQSLGNRANVLALVGDSNTANPAYLAPLDYGNYALGNYGYLQDTIAYFHGSFDRHCPTPCSPAAQGSFRTAWVLDPAHADPGRCQANETPLACEYRLQRPSVALILIGTGDHLNGDWQGFEGRYRQIIDYTLARGIIPVLETKADNLEWTEQQGASDDYINNVIRRLSASYDVPLLDVRKAVDPLPNRGLQADNIHYNTPPDGRSADFTGDHLNYGFNVRNLTSLQVLDALRRRFLAP